MSYTFLSKEWFGKVDELVAKAGDLKIPTEMKSVDVNITVKSASGDKQIHMKDGLFHPGELPGVTNRFTLTEELARKILVDADVAAGVQAFLAGELTIEGDMPKLIAMQTVEPSEPQKRLTREIAAITS